VLVVDDDEAKRYVLTAWLRRAGHTVIEAGTGREALERTGAVELVVLDVNLPDMSGYDVCRQIKGDPRTAAIPVVQVSATAVTVADRAAGLTQGADAYLTEPTEPPNCSPWSGRAAVLPRRQRAERAASLLAELTRLTLRINAEETSTGWPAPPRPAPRGFSPRRPLPSWRCPMARCAGCRPRRSVPSPRSVAVRSAWRIRWPGMRSAAARSTWP